MKIKLLSAAAVLAIGFSAAPAFADETPDFTITGSAAVVSQYRFRGLSQSDNKPAVQAAFTVSHSSGFYVSMWGSSTAGDATVTPIVPGGTEIDVYGGYTKAIAGVTLDVGGYGYIYPNAPNGNLYEIYGSVAKSVGPVGLKAGINFAPGQRVFNFNFTSPTRHNVYVYGEATYAIGPATLHAHLGHTGGGFDYAKQYIDFTVGASYKWKALTFDISAVGTNIGKSDVDTAFACGGVGACIDYFHRPAKTVAVASLTASF